jgi:hypothetical protein
MNTLSDKRESSELSVRVFDIKRAELVAPATLSLFWIVRERRKNIEAIQRTRKK